MRRLMIGGVLAGAVLGLAAVIHPRAGSADGGAAVVQQQNVQIAINIAVHCPDASQSIEQVAANSATVEAGGASSVSVSQANVQVAHNIAVHSPGASQSINQVGVNEASVTASGQANVQVSQSNTASGHNTAVQSSGASQSIGQTAVNAANVTTGPSSGGSGAVVVSQSNRAVARNRCIGHP